jgi:hypothetical protein
MACPRAAHPAGLTLRHRLGGYREYAAPAELAGWVEALWTYRAPTGDGSTHRVLPDPALSLAVCYTRHPDGTPRAPQIVVIGPKLQPLLWRYTPGAEIAAVKLKLEWAAPTLGIVPADHLGAAHDLAEIHPALAARLLDVLAESRSVGEALDTLTAGIAQATRPRMHRKPVSVARAFDLVRGGGGRRAAASKTDRLDDRRGVATAAPRRAAGLRDSTQAVCPASAAGARLHRDRPVTRCCADPVGTRGD